MDGEIEHGRPPGRFGRRMLAAFLAVSLVPLLLAALLTFWRSASLLEGFVADSVEKTARAYASDVDLFLGRQRARLRGISLDGTDRSGLLRRTASRDPTLDALLLVDREGAVLAQSTATPAGLDAWAVDACRDLVADPDRAMTHSGRGHAHQVVVGVREGDAVLCGQVNFTVHQDLLSERASGALGGTAYIVDHGGTVVCHGFEHDEPNRGRGDVLGPTAARVAARGVPWSGLVRGDVLAAYAPAGSLPWGVWVEVSRDVAAAPLRTWLTQTLGLAGLLALASAGAAMFLVRRLVAPVQDVVAAARRMRAGSLGQQVPVRGDDEIAELAREFNRMSEALKQSHDELDARVQDRTRELQALGTLAAGLAHEIGNPLASMSSELEMMELGWDPDDARRSVPVLRDQVRRMSRLLRELVDLGRPSSDRTESFDATQVVDEVVRLLRHDPRSEGVEMVVEAEEHRPVCTARDRLAQVLVNLGLNALDALEGQGRLTIRTTAAPDDGVRIEVCDDGPGVAPDAAEHVFDPFYTTKDPGKGTGLGLFVSERIVRGIGGQLELDRRAEAGATFVLTLPRCACGDCGDCGEVADV